LSQQLREVERTPAAVEFDLFPAAKSVRQHQSFGIEIADAR
jgi:hypothetical protein